MLSKLSLEGVFTDIIHGYSKLFWKIGEDTHLSFIVLVLAHLADLAKSNHRYLSRFIYYFAIS